MAPKDCVKLVIIDPVVDTFDPSMDGVDTITRAGTYVPADKAKEIKKLARENSVRISKRSR